MGDGGGRTEHLQAARFRKPFYKRPYVIRKTGMMNANAFFQHADKLEIRADFRPQEILHEPHIRWNSVETRKAPCRLAGHLPDRGDAVGNCHTRAASRHDGADCRCLQAEPFLLASAQDLALRNIDRLHAADTVSTAKRHRSFSSR